MFSHILYSDYTITNITVWRQTDQLISSQHAIKSQFEGLGSWKIRLINLCICYVLIGIDRYNRVEKICESLSYYKITTH